MSATSIKAAVFLVSAALISFAVVPALAQGDPAQPTETAQAPPAEATELPTKAEPQSKPVVTNGTPRELQLYPHGRMAPRRCHSTAGTKADAEAYCGPILQCTSGTVVSCQFRQNNQDWICSCK